MKLPPELGRAPWNVHRFENIHDLEVTTDHGSPRHSCLRSAGVSPVIMGPSVEHTYDTALARHGTWSGHPFGLWGQV